MPLNPTPRTLRTLLETPTIELKELPETGQAANSYLLLTPSEGLLFDPAHDPAAWGEEAGKVTALIATHGHFDHIGSVDRWRETQDGLTLTGHEVLDTYLSEPTMNVSTLFGVPQTFEPADAVWGDGETKDFTLPEDHTLTVTAEAYPGHTSSDLIYFIEVDGLVAALITGDVVFADSVGRSDLEGGSPRVQIDSLRRLAARLRGLPQDALACFGHGRPVQVGELLAHNFYISRF